MAKAGRPKADVTKEKVVSIRMKTEEYAMIKEYADSTDKTVTQVIQEGISKLMEQKGCDSP